MIIDYLAYRVFQFFIKKNIQLAKSNTINFMILFEISIVIPIFFLLNGIFHFYNTPENPELRLNYYTAIPIAIILYFANSYYFKQKLVYDEPNELHNRYKDKCQFIPIWLIFISPIIFVFLTPIIYGFINSTLRFPLFE